jgi:hypothetical protein
VTLTIALTSEELGRVYESSYKSKLFRMFLANSSVATATNDGICKWTADELAVGTNGYARASVTISQSGAYDSSDARWEATAETFTFTASGGSLTYNRAVLICGGVSTPLVKTVAADTDVDPSTDRITATSHGLSDGTKVTVRAVSGGTLPTGLTAGATYYAKSVSTDVIALYSDSGLNTIVNITADGTGSMQILNCTGTVHSVWVQSPAVTISDGQSHSLKWEQFTDD